MYSATAEENAECIFITQDSMDSLQVRLYIHAGAIDRSISDSLIVCSTLQMLHPAFKHKMRAMAVKSKS